jgi:hypothetical protein
VNSSGDFEHPFYRRRIGRVRVGEPHANSATSKWKWGSGKRWRIEYIDDRGEIL